MPKELHQGFRESGFESRRCLRMPRRKGSRAERVSSPLVICTRRMRGKLQKNKVAGSSPAPLARQRVVQLDRTCRVSRYLVGAALCPCGVAQGSQMPKELQLPTLVVAGSNPAPAAINANPRIKLGRRRAADSIFEYGKARQHRQMISGIGIWQGSSEVEHVTISSPLVDCPALRRAV